LQWLRCSEEFFPGLILVFLFVNKQSVNYHPPDTANYKYSSFNRNFGFEYNLASSNNLWTGKAMVLKSFSPGNPGNNWVHAANLQYASVNGQLHGNMSISEKIIAQK
jgi:hypothetical protein